jgi:hypothetical protein
MGLLQNREGSHRARRSAKKARQRCHLRHVLARGIIGNGQRAHLRRAIDANFPTGIIRMRLIIALILPWLTFFTIGRPLAGIVCLILQITLIGWLPATIWAVYALSQYKTDQKIERAMQEKRTE